MKGAKLIFEYLTYQGEKRYATVKEINYHDSLRKYVYEGISPFGNSVNLSRDEINKFHIYVN